MDVYPPPGKTVVFRNKFNIINIVLNKNPIISLKNNEINKLNVLKEIAPIV